MPGVVNCSERNGTTSMSTNALYSSRYPIQRHEQRELFHFRREQSRSLRDVPRRTVAAACSHAGRPETASRMGLQGRRGRQQYLDECKETGAEPNPKMLVDLRFHDLRHIAATRLSKIFPNVIELSRITGHSNLEMLARYYHTSAEEARDAVAVALSKREAAPP